VSDDLAPHRIFCAYMHMRPGALKGGGAAVSKYTSVFGASRPTLSSFQQCTCHDLGGANVPLDTHVDFNAKRSGAGWMPLDVTLGPQRWLGRSL